MIRGGSNKINKKQISYAAYSITKQQLSEIDKLCIDISQYHSTQKNIQLQESVKTLDYKNTCRTTAKMILECMLGYKTKISDLFFMRPKYNTLLLNKKIDNNRPFYVLPSPPPNGLNLLFKKAGVKMPSKENSELVHSLETIYKIIEEVPKKAPKDPKTFKKFQALKGIYNELIEKTKEKIKENTDVKADQLNFGADELLTIINNYCGKSNDKNSGQKDAIPKNIKMADIFAKRAQNAISKWLEKLGINFRNSTEKKLNHLEKYLQKRSNNPNVIKR